MEKIIEGLKSQIASCKEFGEDTSEASWKYQEGILISADEAQEIVNALVASITTVEADAMKPCVCCKRWVGLGFDSCRCCGADHRTA